MILLPDTITQTDRKFFFAKLHGFVDAVLILKSGKARDVYAVQFVDGAYLLENAKPSKMNKFGPYRVTPAAEAVNRDCTCTGFGRWGHCKHADALSVVGFPISPTSDETSPTPSLLTQTEPEAIAGR